jgi:DNA-binding NarL/FixJ family response regulator
MLALVETTAHALTINRSQQGFTEREREILNALHPHLVTSYVNALALSQSQESLARLKAIMETAPGAYGYFDKEGKVNWLQDRAKGWLNEFFADEVKHEGKIPHSVRRLVEESKRDNHAPKQLEKSGTEEILVACLGASPVGGWVLRLERKSKVVPPRFRPLPQFSERKNDVLKWMVEGKRNGEIATILHLSPRTVERHVADILAAMGVENRATAIVRAMELCAAMNQGR